VAEKKISSTIVGPNGMHWCRVCKVYVRGTKVSIQEHEQTGRHKHNYRESLKEKKFLEKVNDMQDSVLSAELRRMEREANVAMGLPDVPTVAVPKPLRLDLRLPSASSRARQQQQQQHDAADPNEPFVPKYVPVVRTAAVAPLGPAAVVDDVEAAFRAQIASATVVAAAKPGEWTAVETGESLEQQQQEHHDQQQKQQQQEQQQRRQHEQQRKQQQQVDSDDDDDDDNGTVHSGPRHLGTAMASAAVAAADVTFKKRKGETAAKNRSVRKKIDDDDDNPNP
jgi:hypothetical protein